MLIVFDYMIVHMEANEKVSTIVTELFLRKRKLDISLVFISKSYSTESKTIRLNMTHFIRKICNKRKGQQIVSNHSSDMEFKDFMKLTISIFSE